MAHALKAVGAVEHASKGGAKLLVVLDDGNRNLGRHVSDCAFGACGSSNGNGLTLLLPFYTVAQLS